MTETEKVKAYQRTTSTGQVVTVKAHERMNTEAAVDAQNHEDRPPIAARGGTFPGNRSLPGIWLAPPPVPTLSPDAKAAHEANQPDGSTPNHEIASNGNETDGHHVHLHVDTKTGKVVTAAQRYLADVVALARPVHVEGYRRRNKVTGKVSTVHPYVQGRAVAALQDLLDRPHVQARSGTFGQTGAEQTKALTAEAYFGQHRPDPTGPKITDLTKTTAVEEGWEFPSDVYEHPEYYGQGGNDYDRESARVIRRLRGKPDDTPVTIYRGLPPGDTTFNPGDWVTISKAYAQQHVDSNGEGDWQIIATQVPAKYVINGGNDIVEWGYWGPSVDTAKTEEAVKAAPKPRPKGVGVRGGPPEFVARDVPKTLPATTKWLKDLPVGSQMQVGQMVFTKTDPENWEADGSSVGFGNEDFADALSEPRTRNVSHLVKMGNGTFTPKPVGTNAHGVPKSRAALSKFLAAQPEGSTIEYSDDQVFVKTKDGWVGDNGEVWHADVAGMLAQAPNDEAWDSISVVRPDQDTSKHVKYTGTPHAPRTYGSTIPDSKFEPPLLASGKRSNAAKPKAELAKSEEAMNRAANYVPQAVADQLTAVKIRSHDADDAAVTEETHGAALAFVNHETGTLPNMHLPDAMFAPDLEQQKAGEQPNFDWNTGSTMNWFSPTDVSAFDRLTGHEAGHAWEAVARELGDRQQVEQFYSDLTDIVMDQLNLHHFPSDESPFFRWAQVFHHDALKIGGATGAYARTLPEEFLAENWTEYVNSKNPRPLAQAVGSRMQDMLDDVAKTITATHPTPHGKDLYA